MDDKAKRWILISSIVLLAAAIVVIVVLVLPQTGSSDNSTNLSSASSCCALQYSDSAGNVVSVCGYQPFRDNPDSTGNVGVNSRLLSAASFAQACQTSGGESYVRDTSGVECSCTCVGATKDLAPIVAADGQYYTSLSRDSPVLVTSCPGYRS